MKTSKTIFGLIIVTFMTVSLSNPAFAQALSVIDTTNSLANSDTPMQVYTQKENLEAQKSFWTFVNKVAGINTTDCIVSKFRIGPMNTSFTEKFQVKINAIICKETQNISIGMVLTDGKVTSYQMGILDGNPESPQLSVDSTLNIAKNIITAYQNFFNASNFRGFDQLVPQTTKATNVTFDSQKITLNVQFDPDGIRGFRNYVDLTWYDKTNGLVIPKQSLQVAFSKTGDLTSFVDNIALYRVATTNIAVSKEDAIAIAMPRINAYALEYGQTIASVDADLGYVSDRNSTRGDRYVIYPQWSVSAVFNDQQQGVFGYSVLIWADNGKVRSEAEDGVLGIAAKDASTTEYLVYIAVLISLGFIGFMIFSRRKIQLKKHGIIGISTTIALISLLLSPVLVQSAFAYPSTTYGSNYQLSGAQAQDVNDLVSDISGMAAQASWDTFTLAGDVTREWLYDGAADYGEDGSIVFYVGHGSLDGTTMYADDPNDHDITDEDIYDNSNWHTSISKFAYFHSCNLANAGMPYAWLHTTSLSSDGFAYPDDSGKCFIGWTGSAPVLNLEVNGEVRAAYDFISYFYESAFSGSPVNDALNDATQELWGVNFDSSYNYFHEGWSQNQIVFGYMVVYGQGDMYIDDEPYVDTYVDIAAGWYTAQVTDPDKIEGRYNNNQCTQLYATYHGDYAWISGHMSTEASGYLHLWAQCLTERSQLIVYVSDDYNTWSEVYNSLESYSEDLTDINCGYISDPFSYIAICVQDLGYPAIFEIDAVHVRS